MNGIIKGSIIQIHRARTVMVDLDGMITASELGIFPDGILLELEFKSISVPHN